MLVRMDSQQPHEMHFEGLCRTCMHEEVDSMAKSKIALEAPEPQEHLRSISEIVIECDGLRIAELLTKTIPQFKIKADDDLPQTICGDCLEQLVKVYKFQEMCLGSDKQMREFLRNSETKDRVIAKETRKESETSDAAASPNITMVSIVGCEAPADEPLQCKLERDENEIIEEFIDEKLTVSSIFENEPNMTIKEEIVAMSEEYTAVDSQSSESDSEQMIIREVKPKEQKKSAMNSKGKATDVEQPIESYSATEETSTHYLCAICSGVFTRKYSLRRHLKLHQSEPKMGGFICDICPRKFDSRRSLSKHKHGHREKWLQKPYVCEHCNKVFQQSSTLRDHSRLHTGELPFLCSECGKAFHSKSNLNQHLLCHSGVKRFECPECPKKFTTRSSLTSHKVVHSTEKRHVCNQCGAAFHYPYELKRHNYYHTGEKRHKCEYCEMRFARGDQRRRHLLTHTGEKPYKCKYCDRAFAQSNDCIKHLRSHLGENVYRCELCPSAFRMASELRKHLTMHKNEDEETRERNRQALMKEGQRFGLNIVTSTS